MVALQHSPDGAVRPSAPVLVLGSTGTTGSRVVAGLRRAGAPVRAASRSPRPAADPAVEPVRFSWEDPETHGPALAGAAAVYLLPPPATRRPEDLVLPFVDRAREAGVGRVVLLGASSIEAGDTGLGAVYAALAAGGPGWAVLRPTWFAQNLLDPAHHVGAAVAAGRDIVTATGVGRIPFVDATDIAAVAVRTLLDPAPHDEELVLTGPQALSYDDVAALLTRVGGRRVRHRAVDAAAAAEGMTAAGIPRAFAALLAAMEERIAAGSEDRTTDAVLRITGRPPRSVSAVLDAEAGRPGAVR